MASSLARIAQKSILSEIQQTLAAETHNATFAVGGSIPIETTQDANRSVKGLSDENDAHSSCRPVQIRFGEDGKGMTLTLPIVARQQEGQPARKTRSRVSAEGKTQAVSNGLSQLLAACSPAGFGRGSEEVLDESYRKAGKLDTDAFATTFCPYSTGIIDLVQQLLLPHSGQQNDHRGIRAELYKLNVYSAPSGLFKSHIDTPRGETQIGSLVVCLPVEHKGGQLVVRHGAEEHKKEQVFDWSQSSTEHPTVQWAAFYSDCEHEVLEVTSGHRITLTYNLFSTVCSGYLAGGKSSLDATQLPLYQTLSTALESPSFLPGGRLLGVWLTHDYAHTSATMNHLPSSLKGADMVIYEAAKSLGLECHLRPFLRDDSYWGFTVLGDGFRPFKRGAYIDEEEDNAEEQTAREEMGATENWQKKKVIWLNEQRKDLMMPQTAHPTYGNVPSVDIKYTSAIMLVKIPSFSARGHNVHGEQAVFEGIATPSSVSSKESERAESEKSEDEDADERSNASDDRNSDSLVFDGEHIRMAGGR